MTYDIEHATAPFIVSKTLDFGDMPCDTRAVIRSLLVLQDIVVAATKADYPRKTGQYLQDFHHIRHILSALDQSGVFERDPIQKLYIENYKKAVDRRESRLFHKDLV